MGWGGGGGSIPIQVKSSQSSNFIGSRARRLWGARRRERSGGRGAAQLAWLDSPVEPRGFIHIVFFLIVAAPHFTNFVPFSGSLQYGNATPLQADDGSDRGMRECCYDELRCR